jgi:hypothetical protein
MPAEDLATAFLLKPDQVKTLAAAMALLFKICDGPDQAIRAEADPIASLVRNFIARHK